MTQISKDNWVLNYCGLNVILAIDSEVKKLTEELCDIADRLYLDDSDDDAEMELTALWIKQGGIDPVTGEIWLTPKMEKNFSMLELERRKKNG